MNSLSRSSRLMPLGGRRSVSAPWGGEVNSKVGCLEPRAITKEDGPLDRVLELADVARPGIQLECLERGLGEATQALVELAVEAVDEVLGQEL